ncbi:S-layer homology domain-containing protein [Candidatus Peregrinibacteria bacterium]|nr:S-layer homology domain-containing protein [Candidatus Peregrinibacteria bacterium]
MFKRFAKFAVIPILILIFLLPSLMPFAEGFSFPDRYDLVAILVEQGLYEDIADYKGLAGVASGPISETTLKSRIDRYAIDLQNALPGTRAVIIQTDRFEKTENIAAVLEKLYSEGDPKEPTRTAYLRGVIVVGEVPLPVVNKGGNRFISLFPYTDFEQRVYIFNPASGDFEFKGNNANPQPEIWHGVITPPDSTQLPQGKQMLAAYFDKNHLYHIGDSAYAQFDKKVFFQDFFEEAKNLNPIAYKNYLKFLDHQGDIAYIRYTKQLFKDLSGDLDEEMDSLEEDAKKMEEDLKAFNVPMDKNVPPAQVPSKYKKYADKAKKDGAEGAKVDKDKIPDITTKFGAKKSMSDSLMSRFNDIFLKYPNLINDFMKYTGRYYDNATGDIFVDSAVNLITAKDQFTLEYLKSVNTMIENKIDEYVKALQSPVAIGQTVEVKFTRAWEKQTNGLTETIAMPSDSKTFVSFSPKFLNSKFTFFPDRMNGWQFDEITDASQCTLYRGSKGIGYSKLVEANKAYDLQTSTDYDNKGTKKKKGDDAITGRTPEEKKAGYKCYSSSHDGKEFPNANVICNIAGETVEQCFAGVQKEWLAVGKPMLCANPQSFYVSCFDDNNDAACESYKNSLQCFFGNLEDNTCEGYEDFAGCFYGSMGQPADDLYFTPSVCFPDHATDPVFDIAGTREVKGDPPLNYDSYKSCLNFHEKGNYISYLNNVDTLLESIDGDYNDSRDKKLENIQPYLNGSKKDIDPNSWKIFKNLDVTLGDVLIGASDSWQSALADLLNGNAEEEKRVAAVNHPKIGQVEVELKRHTKKEVPSIIYHKEPTNETLNAQVKNMVSRDLPVDQPRYVTFQNAEMKLGKIIYPDLFSEESFDSYAEKLKGVEKELKCTDCLTPLVSNLPEMASGSVVSRANKSKILDSLQWKDMDIDSKHRYIAQYYLDLAKNAYIGEPQNGYEMLYLNGEGSFDGYEFSLNKVETEEAVSEKPLQSQEKEEPYIPDPNNPFDSPPDKPGSGSTGYDLFSWDLDPVSPWWDRVQEWWEKQKEIVNSYGFGKSDKDFYEGMDAENKKAGEKIKEEMDKVYSNPLAADSLDLEKIAKVSLETDSPVVSAGKKISLWIKLKDKAGEVVNDEIAKLTLALEGEGSFAGDLEDDEPDTPGQQITLISGVKKIGILTGETAGSLKISAQLEGTDKKAEILLTRAPDAKLLLETPVTGFIADGKTVVNVNVSAVSGNSKIIPEANGKVSLALSNPEMGKLQKEEIELKAGKSSFSFIIGKKKGDLIINATTDAFDSGQMAFSLLPGQPISLALTADKEILEASAGQTIKITASLYDANDNLVDTNSAAKISFKISDGTKDFGLLSSASEQVKNGSASVLLLPTAKTGNVQIIAESPGLVSGSIVIKSRKKFGLEDILKMQPNALTAALLGIPAGDITRKNYLGGLFVMNGKTQSAVSLTANPMVYKKIFEIKSNNGVDFPEPSRISAKFLPANNFTFVLRDNALQEDMAQVTIYTVKEGQFEITEVDNPEKLADGIYLRKIASDEIYKVDKAKGALRLVKNDSEKIEVHTNGFTKIFDNDFSVKPVNGDFLRMQVLDKSEPVAEIFFVQRFSQDVFIQDKITEAPGVYVKPLTSLPNILYKSSFNGNSSANPNGVSFYDKSEEVQGPNAPGFSFSSLDDSLKQFGIGFTQDNKFALLFSGGEMFGEANRPFASDIGIVLGDPTVKVNNKKAGGFSKDIGKLVLAGSSEVRGILGLDYNTDGYEDILVVSGDGKIRLIQNNGGYDQLKDQGFILDVKNGIQDFTKTDFNNDGQMDLIIAGRVSCRKTDTCVDVYENQGGAFVRNNLHFNETAKIVTVKAEDLNGDKFPDIVLADAAGDIKVLYNHNGKFDNSAQFIGNIGLQVDPAKNLIKSVLVNYPGMTTKNPTDPQSIQSYKKLALQNGASVDFIYADLDAGAFFSSTKFGEDLNGGVLQAGDRVHYKITLKNNSAAPKNNISLSDVFSDQVELDMASIKIETEPLPSDFTRKILFKNISVPAKGSTVIEYEVVFKGDSSSVDKIKIVFSNKFEDKDVAVNAALKADNLPDISVTKEGNPTGQVRYYYTLGADKNGIVQFGTAMSSPPETEIQEEFEKKTGIKKSYVEDEEVEEYESDALEDGEKVAPPPASAQKQLDELTTKDSDNDGIQDIIDDALMPVGKKLDEIAGVVGGLINKLTCDAGCIALPMNAALFAPGFWSILGTPDGYDIGTPVFGWGAPFLVTTYPPMPALSTVGGRIYVSPTLTLGVGFAVCLGSFFSAKNCYSFGVNPLDMIAPGVCDSINGGVSGALAKANDAISKVNEGMTVTLSGEGASVGAGARESEGSGMVNYSLGSYETSTNKSVNVRIPGFPSLINDWYTAQMEEIVDKALAVPDIYLIYPSGDSILGAFKATESFNRTGNFMTNLLSYLNSIPLIDIETQEVLFKVPAITRKEWEAAKTDAKQWVEDEKLELDRWMAALACFGIPQAIGAAVGAEVGTSTPPVSAIGNPELCKFVSAEMNKLIKSVTDNMKALDEWILFPKKILQFRAIEAFYLNQIIDYLDALIKFTGGWAKKNTAIVKQWRRAVREIKDVIENWKAMLELMIEYNESCDKCKTERYSLKDLILKLFIGIPSPPVIPIPKLPDIIVDVSKIQAGARIQWPDVKFKPERITIPRLPRIRLGIDLTIPLFKLMLPALPVIPSPPELPRLPSLPPLNLPQLPSLPPAPTMPGLPGPIKITIDIFKKIVKILCLIRLGFLPTDEFLLKTRIEEITARGLTPLLPIDTMFTIQTPPITVKYIDQLIITAFSNFQFETSYVQDLVESVAAKANKFSTNFVKGINRFTDTLSKQLEKYTSPKIQINVPGPEGKQLNYNDDKALTKELSYLLGIDATELVSLGRQMKAGMDSLRSEGERRKIAEAKAPKEIRLEMKTQKFDATDDYIADDYILDDEDVLADYVNKLKEYRNALLAHVTDTERMAALGGDPDLQDLGKFIESQQKSPFIANSLKKYIAASDFDIATNKGNREIAYKIPSPPGIPMPGIPGAPGANVPGLGGPSGVGQIKDIGLFYIDEKGGSERLINYTLEADLPSKLADIDLDNDGDSDKIYSYGSNVYIKRNEREEAKETQPIFRPQDLEFWTIFELMPKGGVSPLNPAVLNETAREASFSFSGTNLNSAEIAGYEVIAKTSPFFFETSGKHKTLRLHLLSDAGLKTPEIPEDSSLKKFPEIKSVYASLSSASGAAMFTGQKREYVSGDSKSVRVKAGETIHPLKDSKIKWDVLGADETSFKISSDILLPVPADFAEGVDIEVEDGFIEIFRSEKATQPVAAGMAIVFGDKIEVATGSVTVNYQRGGNTNIKFDEIYILNKIEDTANPTANVEVEPGFYFAKIYAFDINGIRSSGSEKFLLAPQVCGDDDPPFADFGKTEFQIAVGKTLKLDASRSFDSMGKIVDYALDNDVKTEPFFTIGPYSEVGQKKMRLTVRDEALNEGYQDITVDVITPRIVLDGPPLRSNIISGYVEPKEERVPITIARKHRGKDNQGWEILKTPSADPDGQYYTNADGKFVITDADLKDKLVVKNSFGQTVAEIDPKTGRIEILDSLYEQRVIPMTPPNIPTRIGIFLKTDVSIDNPLTYVYFIPDVNTDAAIDGFDVIYDSNALKKMNGVHIKPSPQAPKSGFKFIVLPADDEHLPGAAIIEKEEEKIATIDVNGNILFFNPEVMMKVKKEENASDPVVFEMYYNKDLVAEIFIAAHLSGKNEVQIADAPKLPPRPKPVIKKAQTSITQPFTDIAANDPFAKIVENLFKRKIIAGYPSNIKGELLFKPENLINRAEFTQITLKMLCIIPREEARKLPSPFYDVLDEKLWFYPVLKEGNIRGFIKGYIGELKNSQTPFKPANFITRAEAATVVLAALYEEQIIDLSKVDFTPSPGAPWYEKYVEIAQDLKPYLKNPKDVSSRAFLITKDEARHPDRQITRRDFAIMADRVLLMYDCYDFDTDDDGLLDSWERDNGKEPGPGPNAMGADEDPDGDKCTNIKEQELGTNPFDADTDKGGVFDCAEMEHGTDPVNNPFDDIPLDETSLALAKAEISKNEEGIFVLRPQCADVCPCRALIGPAADLSLGDTLFASITGKGGIPIYAKSNEETY